MTLAVDCTPLKRSSNAAFRLLGVLDVFYENKFLDKFKVKNSISIFATRLDFLMGKVYNTTNWRIAEKAIVENL